MKKKFIILFLLFSCVSSYISIYAEESGKTQDDTVICSGVLIIPFIISTDKQIQIVCSKPVCVIVGCVLIVVLILLLIRTIIIKKIKDIIANKFDNNWYMVSINYTEDGPYNHNELQKRIKNKDITQAYYILILGTETWTKISEKLGFKFT